MGVSAVKRGPDDMKECRTSSRQGLTQAPCSRLHHGKIYKKMLALVNMHQQDKILIGSTALTSPVCPWSNKLPGYKRPPQKMKKAGNVST